MAKWSCLILFMLLSVSISFAGQQDNLATIDSLAAKSAETISAELNRIGLRNNDTISLKIVGDTSANWLFIKQLDKQYSIVTDENKLPSVKIVIEKIATTYSSLPHKQDSLMRNIILKCLCLITDKKKHITTFSVPLQYEDTISYDLAQQYSNNATFPFANAQLPERSTSLWKKWIEPAVAVVSAAIITTLFFSVRSAN
jgi:hypothetical protein